MQPRAILPVPCCSWLSIKQTSAWGTCTLKRVEIWNWPLASCLSCSLHKPQFIQSQLPDASGHSASSCSLPTWGPWEGSPSGRPCNYCWDRFLNLHRGRYWEFNWSISHFPLRALERPILLLPNSLLPPHQALSGPSLCLFTTMCIIHARQVTVERVTFVIQAWLSNAAPYFGREVGFIGVWAWCFPVRKPPPSLGEVVLASTTRENLPSTCPVG